MIVGMQHFVHDDAGYLRWLSQRPTGLVVNTYSKPSLAYPKLHHGPCAGINRYYFANGEYSKLCGDRSELEQHGRRLGGMAQPCAVLPLTNSYPRVK
jgi:hypothetical protein